MYHSPNFERRHNRRGGGPRTYFLTAEYEAVYCSAQGARWMVMAKTLEQAIDKAQRGDVLRSW